MRPLRGLLLGAAGLGGLLLAGTWGYHRIEGWSLLDSFYMTAITITTVGFGEVHGLHPEGRLFTLGLIVIGTVSIGYAVSRVTAGLVSGELRKLLKGQRMERRLSRMKDHVILCGWGKIGREIARECMRGGVGVCVVEQDERKALLAVEEGLTALAGDATDEHVLERAGIRQARGVLTALPKDSDNLFVTLTARELNPDLLIVARGLEPSSDARLRRAGANQVVSPYVIGGRRMAAAYLYPEIVDFLDVFMKRDDVSYSLFRWEVRPTSPLSGKRLADSGLREAAAGALVLGLMRGAEVLPTPTGETELRADDVLILLGAPDLTTRLERAGF